MPFRHLLQLVNVLPHQTSTTGVFCLTLRWSGTGATEDKAMRAAAQQTGSRPIQWSQRLEALALALCMTAGCTTGPVDEAEEYQRKDARIRATEQFRAMQRACRAAGGVVVTEGGWGRLTQPTPMDLTRATCASRAALRNW